MIYQEAWQISINVFNIIAYNSLKFGLSFIILRKCSLLNVSHLHTKFERNQFMRRLFCAIQKYFKAVQREISEGNGMNFGNAYLINCLTVFFKFDICKVHVYVYIA